MSKSSQPKTPAHRVPPYRRPIVVVSFLIILIVAIAVTIIIFMSLNHPEESLPDTPKNPPTVPVSPSEPDQPNEQPPEPEDKVTQFEGEDPNTLQELTGRIAYKAVNREPNYQTLTVSVSIDQYLHDSGTCTLSLKNSSRAEVYSASLPADPDVTTSACGPFEVPISDFSPGAYQIEVTVAGDGKTGLITDVVQL